MNRTKDGENINSHTDDLIAVAEGIVEHGDKRGRELGFPTANVRLPGTAHTELEGVYAGTFQVEPNADGPLYVTAVSVGNRPTFYGTDAPRLLEAHLLDFEGDLYGKEVRVELRTALRQQQKYVDAPTLERQLRLDVQAARSWAAAEGLEHLLDSSCPDSPAPAAIGGRAPRPVPVVRRKRTKGDAKSAERCERREQQIRQVIEECGGLESLTPEWLAQRTGLPLDYVRWYLRSPNHGST